MVFHDKSIDHHGRWKTTKAERRFSAEASILLAHKWSRPRCRDQIIRNYEEEGEPTDCSPWRAIASVPRRDGCPSH